MKRLSFLSWTQNEPAQSFADCLAVYNLSESCVWGMLCLYAYKKGEWKVMKFSEACESLLQTFIESLLSPLHYGRRRVSTESAYKIENCSDSVVLYPAVQDFFFSQSKSNSGHWVITTNIRREKCTHIAESSSLKNGQDIFLFGHPF